MDARCRFKEQLLETKSSRVITMKEGNISTDIKN